MLFNQKYTRTPNQHNFSVEDETLELVDSYKYLGHIVSNSRNTHKLMHEHLAMQAQKAMHALKERVKSTVGYLPPKLSLKMFDTHVLPILEYNSEVWFPEKEVKVLERIQMKYLKNLLCVRTQTSTMAILGDTGRFPLLLRQQASAFKYLDRLNSGACPTLLRDCFEIQKDLHSKNSPCWLSRLHKIAENLSISLDNFSSSKAIACLYERAQDMFIREINDSTKNPKLRTYKLFKKDCRLEPYLNYNLPKSVFRSIARLRLSSHNLNIELGRHKRPYVPPDERICEKCDLNEVEDEFHCVVTCTKWNTIRTPLFETASRFIDGFTVISPAEQFLQILKNKDLEMNFALGKFLNVVLNHE